jgi:energy-coupling factor transport system permease protein
VERGIIKRENSLHERLSFYIKRDSLLHSLNPLTKLTLAFGLTFIAFLSPWYWTPQFVVLAIIIPLSILGRIQREYIYTALRLILPATAFLFIMQALFQPIGKTIIFQFWFLHITRESLSFAFANASRIFAMVSSFTLFLLTTHPSELMSDLTRRGLPSQFAYVIISTIQIIPQMQSKAQTIIAAQRSRGLETEGSIFKRIGALVPLVGPLVFGSLVEVEERAIAIEARGFTSTHKKTSLREIQDTGIDKILRSILVLMVLVIIALKIWAS